MIKKFERVIKLIFDIIFSLAGIVILFIPSIAVALLIKLDSRGPVFFRADRVGEGGRIFKLYKFRSMVDNAINMGLGVETEKDDFRITKIGRFLRNWSLDELPQILNVLKGDMSLIGPRPALPHQVEKYNAFEKTRLKVKPGITGWAQVNGRNILSWKERIKLDVWYVDNWSIFLDFIILVKTPIIVLTKKGLYGAEGKVKDYE